MNPNANVLVKKLHPTIQKVKIKEIQELNPSTKLFVFESAENRELAYYEAGCYIPVHVEISNQKIERPYSLCSSPKEAENGIYKICVKANSNGYVSNYIIEHWKVGNLVELGSPEVAEVYNPMRDYKHVVALAGGVAVTPFYSMAKALKDGDNDHELTLIYGANTEDELLFMEDFKQIEKDTNGKFKVIPVLAKEKVEGYEQGFITLDIVKKYCDPFKTSFFISGPPMMVQAMKSFLEPLHLKKKQIRVSMNGDSGFNHTKKEEQEFNLTVHVGTKVIQTKAKSNETILVAIEKAGIEPAVRCRSGVCGFCRAMVIKGDYTFATDEQGLRKADQKLGFIHRCCSYPQSDLEIVVQRSK